MLIDRVLYPVTTLGPGNRLVIWTVGCSKHCHKCANPELWEFDQNRDVSIDVLCMSIKHALNGRLLDGITITGGDPLEQASELNSLLEKLKKETNDIAVYTGYTLEEAEMLLPHNLMKSLRKHISVLIDGPYIDELNDNQCALRGSSNQMIHFFDSAVRQKYEQYIQQGRKVQNIFYGNQIMSVGIHNRE